MRWSRTLDGGKGAWAGIVAAEVIGVGCVQGLALCEGTDSRRPWPAFGSRAAAPLRGCRGGLGHRGGGRGGARERSSPGSLEGIARDVGDMSSPQLAAVFRRAGARRLTVRVIEPDARGPR
ncbi:hypothetical protein RHA1_ro08759 (plasmid) [Rhodococcus jostii RHA1]|uniref:Uncharacterized protein n=1 Tax=Rhodococcus jostii (strain RHA1) TaxID=101510 RepID=Q0RY33_RHOJR|nr:hypothetical protein RHA1_ro08759 [Rhodococcus jostii RHA1]